MAAWSPEGSLSATAETTSDFCPAFQWCLYQPTRLMSFHDVVWWQRKHWSTRARGRPATFCEIMLKCFM